MKKVRCIKKDPGRVLELGKVYDVHDELTYDYNIIVNDCIWGFEKEMFHEIRKENWI